MVYKRTEIMTIEKFKEAWLALQKSGETLTFEINGDSDSGDDSTFYELKIQRDKDGQKYAICEMISEKLIKLTPKRNLKYAVDYIYDRLNRTLNYSMYPKPDDVLVCVKCSDCFFRKDESTHQCKVNQ